MGKFTEETAEKAIKLLYALYLEQEGADNVKIEVVKKEEGRKTK